MCFSVLSYVILFAEERKELLCVGLEMDSTC